MKEDLRRDMEEAREEYQRARGEINEDKRALSEKRSFLPKLERRVDREKQEAEDGREAILRPHKEAVARLEEELITKNSTLRVENQRHKSPEKILQKRQRLLNSNRDEIVDVFNKIERYVNRLVGS